MKKLLFVSVILLSITTSAFTQVENVAKEVLKAYKNRDVELLKKQASGIMIMAISESYFEDKGIQDDLKAVDGWDGEFREIRYNSGDMMGQKVYIAAFHFADVPDNNDELYTVVLSSTDKQNWVMLGTGIVAEKKEEFNKMSLTITEEKEKDATEILRNMSLEMYEGDSYAQVSQKILTESFNTLSEDNFFIGLTNKDDFIQVAYSDKGYSVDYRDASGHFEATEFLSEDDALQVLIDYLEGNKAWKEGLSWVALDY